MVHVRTIHAKTIHARSILEDCISVAGIGAHMQRANPGNNPPNNPADNPMPVESYLTAKQ